MPIHNADIAAIFTEIADRLEIEQANPCRSREDLSNLRFGIGQARRGWLEPADVPNTHPLSELRRLLARVRQ